MDGPRARARTRAEGARAGGPRAGSGARRAGRAAADRRGTGAATKRPSVLAAALAARRSPSPPWAQPPSSCATSRPGSRLQPNSVAVIDPTTTTSPASSRSGSGPARSPPAEARSGSGTLDDKTLQRVDPGSRTVAKTFTLGATPTGVAFGDDAALGRAWADGTGVTRSIPSSTARRHLRCRPDPAALDGCRRVRRGRACGPSSATRRSARIDPGTAIREWTVRRTRGRRPSSRAAARSGSSASANSTVYRYSPETFLEGPIGRASVARRSTGDRLRPRLRLGHQRDATTS